MIYNLFLSVAIIAMTVSNVSAVRYRGFKVSKNNEELLNENVSIFEALEIFLKLAKKEGVNVYQGEVDDFFSISRTFVNNEPFETVAVSGDNSGNGSYATAQTNSNDSTVRQVSGVVSSGNRSYGQANGRVNTTQQTSSGKSSANVSFDTSSKGQNVSTKVTASTNVNGGTANVSAGYSGGN